MSIRNFPIERQLDSKDCGPACLKMISRYYGKFYSLQYLRDKCGLNKEGVSFLDISYAAEEIGFRTISIKCTAKDLIEKVTLPAVIHWNNSHFVVIYRIDYKKRKDSINATIYIADPARGKVKYSLEEFCKKWIQTDSDNGVVMALEPGAQFYDKREEDKIKRKKTLSVFLAYLKPYKKSFINLFLVMLVVTVLQTLLPFISKSVIDVGIQGQDLNFINIVLIANGAILVSILLSNMVRDWILLHVTSRINIALISDYLIKLMNLPVTFFENKMTGDILQRANDHDRIREFIMGNSLNIIFSTITFVVFSVVMWIYNIKIFIIFLIGSILYVSWVMAFLKLRRKLDWEQFELIAKNQSYWIETINCIQDIKLNNYEKVKRWKWEKIQARLYETNKRSLSINNTQNLGAQFIDSLKNLLITFFCAKAVVAGEITFGVLIATQFIIGMLNAPVLQFIQFIISFQFAKISFLRINEIHELEDESESITSNNLILPENCSLILNNVSFQYSKNSPVILKNIRLIIPEGKVTAIVGESGCGKSTLLKLLLRLYNPSNGEIQIGNMNITNISLNQWRSMCGAVMQDGKIFNDTILNNIVLSDEAIDQVQLKNAVTIANIAQEIEQLPLGYKTVLGDQGRLLSGGQKQRLLIARALYKNPEYIFFDEATNSLDSINEQKIVNALDNVFKNKTVIVVAHRLSTIQNADQIIVMHKGMVVEVGNHETLLQRKGRYCQLLESQLSYSQNNNESNLVVESKLNKLYDLI